MDASDISTVVENNQHYDLPKSSSDKPKSPGDRIAPTQTTAEGDVQQENQEQINDDGSSVESRSRRPSRSARTSTANTSRSLGVLDGNPPPVNDALRATYVNLVKDIVDIGRIASLKRSQLSNLKVEKTSSPAYFLTEPLVDEVLKAVLCNENSKRGFHQLGTHEELKRICVEKLLLRTDINFEIVKMQAYLNTMKEYQREVIDAKRQQQERMTLELRNVIINTRDKTVGGLENVHRKLASYITMLIDLGSPTDLLVVKATHAALESVFPKSELVGFYALPKKDKIVQLDGLVQLVMGVRLFNYYLGKSGVGVVDLTNQGFEIADGQYTEVKQMLEATNELIVLNTDALDRMSASADIERSTEDEKWIQKTKSALIFAFQALNSLREISDSLANTVDHIHEMQMKLKDTVKKLKKTCRSKDQVPADEVYPNFMLLAAVWTALQDTITLLAGSRDMIEGIKDYFDTLNNIIPEIIPKTSEIIKPIVVEYEPEVEAMEEGDGNTAGNEDQVTDDNEGQDQADDGGRNIETPRDISPLPVFAKADTASLAGQTDTMTTVTWIDPKQNSEVPPVHVSLAAEVGITQTNVEIIESNTQDPKFMDLFRLVLPSAKMGLAGFCPTTLFKRGYFKLGRPELGLVRFRNQVYCFAGIEDARQFIRDPKHVMESVIKASQNRLDWMHLLNLDSQEYLGWIPQMIRLDRPKLIEKSQGLSNVGCQTDTHISYDGEPHIDRNYQFNEWDLRRHALQMVSLRSKMTRSMQTKKSHFRRDNVTQTWVHGKTNATQTRKEAGTGPPLRVQFHRGLRGGEKNPYSVVDLVLEI